MMFFAVILCPQMSMAAVTIDGAFSVVIPPHWEQVTANFSKQVPADLVKAFDGAEAQDKNLRMVGWKREGGKLVAAYSISYIPSGAGNFNKLMKAAEPSERKRISSRFADTVAQKVVLDYAHARDMPVLDNTVNIMDAGDMTVVIADAIIKVGEAKRTRASTVFFKADTIVQITYLHDNAAPQEILQSLEELVGSISWN